MPFQVVFGLPLSCRTSQKPFQSEPFPVTVRKRLLQHLENPRCAHAATDAHGDQAVATTATLEFVQDLHG